MLLYFNSQPHEEADGRAREFHKKHYHFNSQPHEEADSVCITIITLKRYFNSQPHEEADGSSSCTLSGILIFQLTASRRGWPLEELRAEIEKIFQLTASRRGWHWWRHLSWHWMKYFNSQPHEEADIDADRFEFCVIYFNSQPHEEADHRRSWHFFSRKFQLTASRRGWLAFFDRIPTTVLFQLTASRRGWRRLVISSILKV